VKTPERRANLSKERESAPGSFGWWRRVFDLLDPDDELTKVRFARIQAQRELGKLRRRRPS
jgi:hypothetical protein